MKSALIFGIRPGLHRIEQREQQQTGEKSADMGLPRDVLTVAGYEGHRTEPKQQVEAEPNADKCQHARVAQCNRQRRSRNPL